MAGGSYIVALTGTDEFMRMIYFYFPQDLEGNVCFQHGLSVFYFLSVWVSVCNTDTLKTTTLRLQIKLHYGLIFDGPYLQPFYEFKGTNILGGEQVFN